MADGDLTLKLDDETAQRLKDAAQAAGLSVDDYVRDLIREGLDDGSEDRRIADESERGGFFHSVEEAVAHFRSELRAQVKKAR